MQFAEVKFAPALLGALRVNAISFYGDHPTEGPESLVTEVQANFNGSNIFGTFGNMF